ncbi:MAG: helix-hairpin-helix domain-containing protein [Anaerolineales bacterium]|jgi:methyl-accepting chemotaxis protein
MTAEDKVVVNPNAADLETLMTLPGVGEAMGQRIMDARPFVDLEDMQRVNGLGPSTLARLEPFLQFESGAAGAPSKEKVKEDEAISKPGMPVDGRRQKMAAGRKRSRNKRQPLLPFSLSITQEQWGLVIVTAGISVLLSILLTLSVVAGINGTLDMGKHAAVRQLESQLGALQVDVNGAVSRLDAINLRLEAIEGLSGRVQNVEDQFTTLREDVSGSLDDVAEIQAQIEQIHTDIDLLTQSIGRFDQFLQGLRQLIMEALPALETTTP